jgi:hypothetical protein
MSLAQYASPYNNDETGETDNVNANIRMTQSQNQNQQYRGGGGIKGEKKMPPSSFRKTIKRPLAQQQQRHSESSQSQSRVENFISKLGAVKNVNYLQQESGEDGTGGSDSADLADYQPINSNEQGEQGEQGEQSEQGEQGEQNQNGGFQKQKRNQNGDNNNDDDGVVTRENFETLPSTYASQYYQQYAPLSYSGQQQQLNNASSGSKDDLMQKMNHIIQMLEDQQDEKTGSVTEELILYCFLGVFVIFVVDSFVRAGKYVR